MPEVQRDWSSIVVLIVFDGSVGKIVEPVESSLSEVESSVFVPQEERCHLK